MVCLGVWLVDLVFLSEVDLDFTLIDLGAGVLVDVRLGVLTDGAFCLVDLRGILFSGTFLTVLLFSGTLFVLNLEPGTGGRAASVSTGW